jgi:hypothetical protein
MTSKSIFLYITTNIKKKIDFMQNKKHKYKIA